MKNWFNPALTLSRLLSSAAKQEFGNNTVFLPEVRPADPKFGDFQANGVLPFAKQQRTNPRVLATQLVEALKKEPSYDPELFKISIAGPGFINFTLTPTFLTQWLTTYDSQEVIQAASSLLYQGQKIVVDYPSPNTAKEMHIGHLRPMIIGESIQRLLRFCGAELVRDNHIGDWGTNFGILIMALKASKQSLPEDDEEALVKIEALYKEGSALTQADSSALERARGELIDLQQEKPESLAIWEQINAISKCAFQKIYDRLGLEFDVELGESFYRDKVHRVYEELIEAGIAEESEGAWVVFHPGHPRFSKDAERPQPFIVRKQDGGSNYASTDLAAVLYRSEHFGADKIIYVTDGRQRDHFEQLFLTVKRWYNEKQRPLPELEHVWFGAILGKDGKALKTKSGDSIKLKALLDEAVDRAYAIVCEKTPELGEQEHRRIAEVIGISAVRYADLMQNRTADYIFSWDKLLNFDGNSAPYLLMAGARIHSIFRKLGLKPGKGEDGASSFETEAELTLARKLLRFPFVLDQTNRELRPHYLCTFLYELAVTFSHFYNANKVIDQTAAIQSRRLMLCARTLCILEIGLDLLGLEPLERM